jgi:hypothetical protein
MGIARIIDPADPGRRDSGIHETWAVGQLAKPSPINIAAEFGDAPDVKYIHAHVRQLMQKGLDELAAKRHFPILG